MKTTQQYLHNLIGTDIIQKITDSGDYLYIGTSSKGSLTSEENWKIKRIHKTSGEILWSDDNQIFDNAESLTYS